MLLIAGEIAGVPRSPRVGYGGSADAGSVALIAVADSRTGENILERTAISPHQEAQLLCYPGAKS
jgi:hypothetical protein